MGVGISLSCLSSSVANEGGIGVISGTGIGMLEPDLVTNYKGTNLRALGSEIRKARAKTDGIIGVNLMVALTDCYDLAEVAVKEGADILFLGAGLPLKIPVQIMKDRTGGKGPIKIIPIVSSGRAAKIILKSWAKTYNRLPDAIVVEGPLAGGHLGFKKEQIDNPDFALEKLLPEVISAVKPYKEQFNVNMPVIAAGGIYSGADIYRFMQLGASGVQMGTRFVATDECDASLAFKQEYIKCKKEDIIIIDSPVGLPGRAIQNKFLIDVSHGIRKPFKCPWKCLHTCNFKSTPYCIAEALLKAQVGAFEDGFSFAGTNAYRIDEIIPVKELLSILSEEYSQTATG